MGFIDSCSLCQHNGKGRKHPCGMFAAMSVSYRSYILANDRGTKLHNDCKYFKKDIEKAIEAKAW